MCLEAADSNGGGEHGTSSPPQRRRRQQRITVIVRLAAPTGHPTQVNVRTGWHWPSPSCRGGAPIRGGGATKPPTDFAGCSNSAATDANNPFSTNSSSGLLDQNLHRIGSTGQVWHTAYVGKRQPLRLWLDPDRLAPTS